MTNRYVLRLAGILAPILVWLYTALRARKWSAGVARTECANKLRIMQLVQNSSPYTGTTPDGEPVAALVDRCYALGTFPALWAVEGLGKDLAEARLAGGGRPERLLTGSELSDPRFDKAQLMLHAGIGLGFAKHAIERLGARASDAEVAAAVARVISLCRANSRPGYLGAAVESLGLVSRFLRDPHFCAQVDRALAAGHREWRPYFWRGVGRCVYFHPSNFLPPPAKACCRAIAMCRDEAPDQEAWLGMLSGVGWTTTVVNMSTPEVLEWVLEHHDEYEADGPAFQNGMLSALVMRFDTTPADPLVPALAAHSPSAPGVRDRWAATVAASVEDAVRRIHPVLRRHGRLDEVFRFQNLRALAVELELAEARAAGPGSLRPQ